MRAYRPGRWRGSVIGLGSQWRCSIGATHVGFPRAPISMHLLRRLPKLAPAALVAAAAVLMGLGILHHGTEGHAATGSRFQVVVAGISNDEVHATIATTPTQLPTAQSPTQTPVPTPPPTSTPISPTPTQTATPTATPARVPSWPQFAFTSSRGVVQDNTALARWAVPMGCDGGGTLIYLPYTVGYQDGYNCHGGLTFTITSLTDDSVTMVITGCGAVATATANGHSSASVAAVC